MSTETISLLLVVIPVGALLITFAWLYPSAQRRKQALLQDFRERSEAHYRAFRIHSRDPRFVLDPTVATVVKEKETFALRNRYGSEWVYGVTRYLRNPAGEYFRVEVGPEGVMGHGHVEQHIARIVLKDRYEAPVEPASEASALHRSGTGI